VAVEVCGVDGGLGARLVPGWDARRRRSRDQGWPEATPKGLGLDAGEERRTLITQIGRLSAPGVGWGSVQRTVVPRPEGWQRLGCRASLRQPGRLSMVRSGHDQTGSSRSSTSPPTAGVMPITGSRRAVSEPSHAATRVWARQRISPSRSP
jgi:hypothetical protein